MRANEWIGFAAVAMQAGLLVWWGWLCFRCGGVEMMKKPTVLRGEGAVAGGPEASQKGGA